MNEQHGYVQTAHQDTIATIEFFHPQSNSLPGKILADLAAAIEAEGRNENTRVIILQSAGEKIFCSGASFDELAAITNETEGLQFFSGFAKVINAMRTCGKIIIARIQGKCIGGGVGVAGAADYAIAHSSASVKLSELAVGIGPFVVGPAVERKTGLSAFSQLTIDATNYRSAAWAQTNGLFAEVHDTMDAMDASIQQLASTLAAGSENALKELKQIFWQGTEHWDTLLMERAAISGKLILSDYSKNFISKFKQK